MNLTLPYPPSTNRLWRMQRGRMVKAPAARAYEARVKALAWPAEPYSGPVAVVVRVYRPIRRGDLDNRLKAVMDALQGVAFKNDEQVVDLHATRHEAASRLDARVEVFVTRLSLEPTSPLAEAISGTKRPRELRELATPNVRRPT